MDIKDFTFLSFSNNYEKSHYFNNLIIQEQVEFRLHYFSDLEGFFRINKIKFLISSGSFFITHPGDQFSITPVKAVRTLGYFTVVFKPDVSLREFIQSELSKKAYILSSNQRMTLEEVLGKLNSQSLYLKESAKHHLMALLYDLPEQQRRTQTHPDNHQYIEKALKYMHERVYEELKLDELCRYLCISEPHCIRLFKGRMGTTPMKYFSRIKIEEAVNLLLSTNKPLALIAEELQFSSAAHFSKTFKQYLSISPTQYRGNYINTLEHRQKMSIREREHAYDLLQNIIDASPDLIFYKNTQGVILGGNKAVCEILGITKEQIVGIPDHEVFSREKADFFQKRDELIFKNNRPIKNEEIMTYPNGRQRTFEVSKAPFYDDQGKIIGLIGISRDITDRIHTRQALEAAQNKQKQLSDRQTEVLTSLTEQLIEVLHEKNDKNQDSIEVLQLKLLTEGLYSFIQKLFKTPLLNNKGTDPKLLFNRLKTLLDAPPTEDKKNRNAPKITFSFPEDLPDIVFIDEGRLLRALYFLIRAITMNVVEGKLLMIASCADMLLTLRIRLDAKIIPGRKQKKIEKLIQREEGFVYIASKEDPIELCLANIELECLESKIKLLSNSTKLIELEISTPFPYGIEFLNQYYAQKK